MRRYDIYISPAALFHYGIKGMKWGVRRTPEQLGHKRRSQRIDHHWIKKSVGAVVNKKETNWDQYDIIDPKSRMKYHLMPGTRIRNPKTFAGKGGVKKLQPETLVGLVEEFGGSFQNWQHRKGLGTIDYQGEPREAEIHWFQEESVGRHKFRVKEWLD